MKYAIVLLLSVSVTVIHRFWNNAPVNVVNWFMYSEKEQDVQWYIKDSFDMLASVMFMWVLWKIARGTVRRIAMVLLIYKCADFVMYWINFKTYDYFFVYLIIPIGIILIVKK